MPKQPKKPKKGLTDKELAAKYDTGKKLDFDMLVTAMAGRKKKLKK